MAVRSVCASQSPRRTGRVLYGGDTTVVIPGKPRARNSEHLIWLSRENVISLPRLPQGPSAGRVRAFPGAAVRLLARPHDLYLGYDYIAGHPRCMARQGGSRLRRPSKMAAAAIADCRMVAPDRWSVVPHPREPAAAAVSAAAGERRRSPAPEGGMSPSSTVPRPGTVPDQARAH